MPPRIFDSNGNVLPSEDSGYRFYMFNNQGKPTPSATDDYNQLVLTQYNNDFQKAMWDASNEYNTPSQQMARAKEAGLNANVVAGNVSSGNTSTISSQGKITGNQVSNGVQIANAGINAFNGLLSAVSDGINATSQLSGIPSDIGTYRKMLTQSGVLDRNDKMARYILDSLSAERAGYLTYGVGGRGILDNYQYAWNKAFQSGMTLDDGSRLLYDNGLGGLFSPDDFRDFGLGGTPRGHFWSARPYENQVDLRNKAMELSNKLRSYDLNNLKPEQVAMIKEKIHQISVSAGFTEKQAEMYENLILSRIRNTDRQTEYYDFLETIGIVNGITNGIKNVGSVFY